MPNITRSQDFRFVYASTFAVAMTATDVHITCGIQKEPGSNSDDMEAQVGLITTHTSMKLLAEFFSLLADEHEDQTGRPIDFDPSKLDGLRDVINANRAATGRKLLPPR